MPSLPTPNARSLLDNLAATIDAARHGSFDDLELIVSNLKRLPTAVLPELLEIFLLHLESRKNPADPSSVAGKVQNTLASKSFKGIYTLSRLDEFKRNPAYAAKLVTTWIDNLEYIIFFLHGAQKLGSQFTVAATKTYIVQIFSAIDLVDKRLSNLLYKHKKAQMLVSCLWVDRTVTEEVWVRLYSIFLLRCLEYPKCLDYLVQSAKGPSPTLEVVGLALSRLDSLLDGIPTKERVWNDIGLECAILLSFVEEEGHALAVATRDSGGIPTILRVMRSVAKYVPLYLKDEEEDRSLRTGAVCFIFLERCFRIKVGALSKAIHGGLIKCLFALSPWFAKMNMPEPELCNALENMVREVIPRDLVYVKFIKMMSDCMKYVTPGDRKNMAGSLIADEWNNLEKALVERVAVLLVRTIPSRIRLCEPCGRRDDKASLYQCGKCHEAVYCSRDCQVKDWKSNGHRKTCRKRPQKKTTALPMDITKELVSLDVSRFFDSAIDYCLEEEFDPLKHILFLDYLRVPVQVFARSFKTFLALYKLPEEVLDEFRQRVKTSDRKCVICAQIFGNGPLEDRKMDAIPIEMRRLESLGEGRKNKLPRSPVALGNPARCPMAKPKLDFTDYFLSFCGSTFEEFWKKDIEKIFLNIFLSRHSTKNTLPALLMAS